MCSSGNQKRLQTMIKAELTDIAQSIKQELLYSVGEECTSLSFGTSPDECPSVSMTLTPSCSSAMSPSDHKQLSIILSSTLPTRTCTCRQLPSHTRSLASYIYIRQKNELLLCKSMCSDQNVAKCLIPFHVMTGCGSNSCFYGHTANCHSLRECWKSAEARSLLLKCGESFQLNDIALNDLKIDVMRYVYGHVHGFSFDMLRAEKWRCQKKKSLMRLLPDDDCLKQNITRANFLAYIQRHPELRDHPSHVSYGWTLVNGCCRPVCHIQQALLHGLHTPSTLQAGDGSSGDESRV